MRAFKDCEGREWLVRINVHQLRRAKASLGLDLAGLFADGFRGLAELLGNPVGLVDALFLLCEDEAKARGVTDEAFGRAMAGDALGVAADAFVEELIDFFPPRQRQPLAAAWAKVVALNARAAQEATRGAEALDVEEALGAFLGRSGGSSGGAPGSSASTPTPSPSGS